ncbi:MAG: GGDEF domain-containing protein [Magnetococcales bacterium]|nr:GGDEF domain-containing protein [Magnetococcales bacterium]
MQLTRKLFTDLALWMLTLAVFIGLSFPFFVIFLGFDEAEVLTPIFWSASIAAGLLAGALNYLLALLVVRPRLRLLANRLRLVEGSIREAMYTSDWSQCTPEKCHISINSEDEIGECATAFNDLMQALFRSHEVEAAVADFSKTLTSQLDLKGLSHQGLEMLMLHANAVAGVVLTNQDDKGKLVVSARHGISEPERLADSDYVLLAVRSNTCQKIVFPENVQVDAVIGQFQPREVIVVPVDFKESCLGVIILASEKPFSIHAGRLLELFRQGFGLALNNALFHLKLERIAAMDSLTGVLNRRIGNSRLQEEFHRVQRSKKSLGILMVDIDHFKKINDTYGHLAGDQVLIAVAKTIDHVLRGPDVLVRYGGEEFLCVLPETDQPNCEMIAERIRAAIEALTVRCGTEMISVTLSVGFASYPEVNVDCAEKLVRDADLALYRAKNGGRNRCCSV